MKGTSAVAHESEAKSTEEAGDANRIINDKRFIDQLNEIFELKKFLFEEKVSFKSDQLGSIDLGSLNNLEFGRHGRLPSDNEWKLLDQKLLNLSSHLDDEMRQRLNIRRLAPFFGPIPLTLLLVAALMTLGYAIYPQIPFLTSGSLSYNACYYITEIIWTITQGGLGACAYFGIQVATKGGSGKPSTLLKSSFEIIDPNILKIRIILGALFAFILGIPFSLRGLGTIYDLMTNPDSSSKTISLDIALTLVPFLLGFSTNLVLAIFDRLIESVRTFFGIRHSERSD